VNYRLSEPLYGEMSSLGTLGVGRVENALLSISTTFSIEANVERTALIIPVGSAPNAMPIFMPEKSTWCQPQRV